MRIEPWKYEHWYDYKSENWNMKVSGTIPSDPWNENGEETEDADGARGDKN
jgi:hypothetical protein